MSQVVFIGAGPGDPELLTVKAYEKIRQAEVILYAGSLVNPAVFQHCPERAEVASSASMDLEEMTDFMVQRVKEGKEVLRLHTGDPSLYGAIAEQIRRLEIEKVAYQVIPGISSFLAGAAAMKKELTLPGKSQTVIISRVAGRTPVPEKENLKSLAAHQASLVLFLSVGQVKQVVEDCLTAYAPETPVAIAYRVGWPDQRILRGSLQNLSTMMEEAGIRKTALIYIGDFLQAEGDESLLYDAAFTHEYREGK
ncbi:cobalt-precorrin 4 C11-methyltransferase [Tindallia magadiensis]|uniref:Cobalt-precorrin 4 C11-methyltransferase n=1 Tax=Tindallia magadiensis TaxID=69895 RepID=A0A1I3HVZ4_9FIRM|nr:precorrin-4 C(11)-methyltransferase [Tindallia magadiensis]SFI39928.1 cobalt-precorrin 4 C11-methyltransferase [Tindallia magadiensis]